MNYDCSRFQKGLQELKLDLSEEQVQQFLTFYEYLMEKNKVMNLTGITEFQEVVEKHFLDSVLAARYFDFSSAQSLIDVGTGAGFPGIPLKILYPQLQVVLLDSLRKRVDFLQGIVDNLKLCSVEAVHGRAEEIGRDARFRESFDGYSQALEQLPDSGGTATVTSAVSTARQTHTVVQGDTLWRIAVRYGTTLEELLAVNPAIKNPNLIVVGQEVALP